MDILVIPQAISPFSADFPGVDGGCNAYNPYPVDPCHCDSACYDERCFLDFA